MIKVKSSDGTTVDFEAAVELMDDEIREEVHGSGEFDGDPQGFLARYEEIHLARTGEEFAV